MKSLNKQEAARLAEYTASLTLLRSKIEDEINVLKETAFANLNALIASYNEELEGARGFVEDLSSAMESYSDERSEKWHDSDAGSAYSEWKDNFDSAELDEVSPYEPDLSELEGSFGHPEILEELPQSPN